LITNEKSEAWDTTNEEERFLTMTGLERSDAVANRAFTEKQIQPKVERSVVKLCGGEILQKREEQERCRDRKCEEDEGCERELKGQACRVGRQWRMDRARTGIGGLKKKDRLWWKERSTYSTKRGRRREGERKVIDVIDGLGVGREKTRMKKKFEMKKEVKRLGADEADHARAGTGVRSFSE
jgi:hypothetical protein